MGELTAVLPNAMTVAELMAKGMTPDQAHANMHARVFGVGYQLDEEGNPVERGKGSAAQPTPQHTAALQKAKDRAMRRDGGASAPMIAEAIAAGIALAEKRKEEAAL